MGTDSPAITMIQLDDLNVPLERDAPLGPMTWYGVGGRAAVLARPQSIDELAALARRCHETATPLRILGKGANLLVPEGVVDGVVVVLDAPAFRTLTTDIEQARVTAGGGADFERVITQSVRDGLAGLEGLAGIPATVGGAIRMNAGGAFGEIGPRVEQVTAIEPTGRLATLGRNDLHFAYRRSNIGERIVVAAVFALERSPDPPALRERLKEVMKYKKNSQPMAYASAGCAFKNPRSQTDKPAGWLIDQSGLKGYRSGGAMVSPVHANFIVLEEGGKAADVLAVMEHVEQVVKEKFNVALEREVVVWRSC